MNSTRILSVLGAFAILAVVSVSAQSGTYTELSGYCANPNVKVNYTKSNRDTCVCVRALVANCTRAPVTTTTTVATTTTTKATTEPTTTTAGPVADYQESSVLCILSPGLLTVTYNKTNGDKCRCVKALLANCTRAPVTTTTTEATTTTTTVPTTTTTQSTPSTTPLTLPPLPSSSSTSSTSTTSTTTESTTTASTASTTAASTPARSTMVIGKKN